MGESPFPRSFVVGRCFSNEVPVLKGNSSGSSGESGSPVGAERVIAGAPFWRGEGNGLASSEATGFRKDDPRVGKRRRALAASVGLWFAELASLIAAEVGCGVAPDGERPDSGVSPISGIGRSGRLYY